MRNVKANVLPAGMRRSAIACLVLCAALAGCAVGPDFKAPTQAPVAGLTRAPLEVPAGVLEEGLAVSAQWWAAYRSPAIDQLVAQALAHNPSIDAALSNLQAAQENVKAQQGLFYPSVQAGYNLSRQNTGAVLSSPLANGNSLYTLHTAQLSVGFVPDIFGGNKRQVESLDAQAVSQKYQLGALRITIASNVVAAALQTASLQEQLRVLQEVIGVNRRQLDHLRGLKSAGYSSGLDLASQELAYAQAVAQMPPLRKQLEQTRDLLAILCGQLPNEKLPEVLLDAVSTPKPLPLSLPSQIVEQRPDVQAAMEQLRASNALIGVAVANMLPQISLSAGLGFSQGMLAGLFSPDNRTWGLSAGLLQQVFAGGALQARKRAAEAAAQSAAAQYRSTVLTAFQNVADALYAIESDGQAIQAARDVEVANERLLALAQKQFDLGYVSGLSLLGVRQTYLQARLARVSAFGAYLGDTVALHQALGGGWVKPGP